MDIQNETELQRRLKEVCKNYTIAEAIHAFEVLKLQFLVINKGEIKDDDK